MACTSTFSFKFCIFFLILITISLCSKDKTTDKDKKKKKDIRDYNDADMERLFDEWEDADEDELEEDELPEWKREPPKVDMSKLDTNNPEKLLQETKKGRTLMLFATVSGNPTQEETEKITQIWQGSLFNANIETQRYVVSDNRVIFMLKDGAMAWKIKDYLVDQERCEEVTIEGKNYPGKAAKDNDDKKDKKDDNKKSNKDSKKEDTKDSNKTKKDKKSEKDKNKSKKSDTIDNETSRKKDEKKDEL